MKMLINKLESSLFSDHSGKLWHLRPIQTYMQHGARSTDEKLNEWIPIGWFILARSTEHAARSTDENSRVEQISTFPLKPIYLIMRTHDLYVEVWIKIDPCSMLRAACKYELAFKLINNGHSDKQSFPEWSLIIRLRIIFFYFNLNIPIPYARKIFKIFPYFFILTLQLF